MLTTDDQPTDAHPTDQTTDRRVTVAQAAVLLGLSEDAVRSRLKRGTLGKEKDADGTVFVVMGANGRPGLPTTNADRPTTGQTTDQTALALISTLRFAGRAANLHSGPAGPGARGKPREPAHYRGAGPTGAGARSLAKRPRDGPRRGG